MTGPQHHWQDARLQKALEQAPDAQTKPAAATRDAILKAAHDAVTPAPTTPPPAPWWKRVLNALFGSSHMPWNAAFATLLVAGFIGLLWAINDPQQFLDENDHRTASMPMPVNTLPAPVPQPAPQPVPQQAEPAAVPDQAEQSRLRQDANLSPSIEIITAEPRVFSPPAHDTLSVAEAPPIAHIPRPALESAPAASISAEKAEVEEKPAQAMPQPPVVTASPRQPAPSDRLSITEDTVSEHLAAQRTPVPASSASFSQAITLPATGRDTSVVTAAGTSASAARPETPAAPAMQTSPTPTSAIGSDRLASVPAARQQSVPQQQSRHIDDRLATVAGSAMPSRSPAPIAATSPPSSAQSASSAPATEPPPALDAMLRPAPAAAASASGFPSRETADSAPSSATLTGRILPSTDTLATMNQLLSQWTVVDIHRPGNQTWLHIAKQQAPELNRLLEQTIAAGQPLTIGLSDAAEPVAVQLHLYAGQQPLGTLSLHTTFWQFSPDSTGTNSQPIYGKLDTVHLQQILDFLSPLD
ncbi:hypothetical protein [Saezia sanguinis]|uniref:hypothetical protein n=1 Tax=Saezia sanguinis TaxID=1965230 RepID=UPI003026248A